MSYVSVTAGPAVVTNVLPAAIAACGAVLIIANNISPGDTNLAHKSAKRWVRIALVVLGVWAVGAAAALPTSPGAHPFNGRNAVAAIVASVLIGTAHWRSHTAPIGGASFWPLILFALGAMVLATVLSFDWVADTDAGDSLLAAMGLDVGEWSARAWTFNARRAAWLAAGAVLATAGFASSGSAGKSGTLVAISASLTTAAWFIIAIGVGVPLA